MISRVKFTTIYVADQQRALEFYRDKLGFAVHTDEPMGPDARWIMMQPPKGETLVTLFTPPGMESQIGSFASLCFTSDDVAGTAKELAAKGVEFVEEAKAQPWGGMQAIFKDSEGNSIVLHS